MTIKNIHFIALYMLIISIATSCMHNNRKTACTDAEQSGKINVAESNMSGSVEYVFDDRLTLEEFSEYTGHFPADGVVRTPEVAVKIAEVIWKQIYGDSLINTQKPFLINLENDVWILLGDVSSYEKAGTAFIQIDKNSGEILKITHFK